MWDKKWAVVGFTVDRAREIIHHIETTCGKEVFRKYIGSDSIKTIFADGTILNWIPAKSSCRGFRFSKMWCDKTLDNEIIDWMVLPMYFGDYSDIIWI